MKQNCQNVLAVFLWKNRYFNEVVVSLFLIW